MYLLSAIAFGKANSLANPTLDIQFKRTETGYISVVIDQAGNDLGGKAAFIIDLFLDYKEFYKANFKGKIKTNRSKFTDNFNFKLKSRDRYISNVSAIKSYLEEQYDSSPEGAELLTQIILKFDKTKKIDEILTKKMNLWICTNLRYNIKRCK